MKKFVATEVRADGKRYDVDLFEAEDWDSARRICKEKNWRLDGEYYLTIPASAGLTRKDVEEAVAALNEQRMKTLQ